MLAAPAVGGAVTATAAGFAVLAVAGGDAEAASPFVWRRFAGAVLFLPLGGALMGLVYGLPPALVTLMVAVALWPLRGPFSYLAACTCAGAAAALLYSYVAQPIQSVSFTGQILVGAATLGGLVGGFTGSWLTRPPRARRGC